MEKLSLTRRLSLAFLAGGMAAHLFLAPVAQAAQEEVIVLSREEAPAATPAVGPSLTLADCVRIGLDQQPALAAQRATLAAANAQQQALENLRLAGLISREIPIRRKQAALGVVIATAGVNQAQWDSVYAVTRNFFSVQYALKQQKVARDVLDSLKATYTAAQEAIKAGARDVAKNDLTRINIYQLRAEARLAEGTQGVERALAALREALGVCPTFPLSLASTGLPTSRFDLCREQVVALALRRRGEMAQAVDLAEVTALEVDAQATSHALSFRTFASVVDIHSRPIPPGMHNGAYRPAALGPEMPVALAGHRGDRVHRAREFNARARAVVDKTRNLITLEAEDAFLTWQQATIQIGLTRKAAAQAVVLETDTRNRLTGGGKFVVRDVLEIVVLAGLSQAAANEAQYRQLLALAALQRVTAGGVCPDWSGAPVEKIELPPANSR